MSNDPCKQCGAYDRYYRGKFSYCRPCHNEAQKRYLTNKRLGITREQDVSLDFKTLHELLLQGNRGERDRQKTHCINGHPFSGDNLRIQRTTRRLRRCRTCERNAKRVKYGLPVEKPARVKDLLEE